MLAAMKKRKHSTWIKLYIKDCRVLSLYLYPTVITALIHLIKRELIR